MLAHVDQRPGQRSEARDQRPEIRDQRSEIRDQAVDLLVCTKGVCTLKYFEH